MQTEATQPGQAPAHPPETPVVGLYTGRRLAFPGRAKVVYIDAGDGQELHSSEMEWMASFLTGFSARGEKPITLCVTGSHATGFVVEIL